jgi:hypothetical protein
MVDEPILAGNLLIASSRKQVNSIRHDYHVEASKMERLPLFSPEYEGISELGISQ